ncbi:MAG: prepilin-type N-terminal cleavage/methylation domain-containing protein [Planococcus donghaensis]
MKRYLQQKLNNEKGMTLIELLAVIVIIAIIAAIAIPAIGNIIENSRVGAMKSDALNAITAAGVYYADNPAAANNVAVSTLKTNYMSDTGTLTDGLTISKDGLVNGDAKVSDTLKLTFTGANKKAISGTPNNSAAADYLNATHGGLGTVKVVR